MHVFIYYLFVSSFCMSGKCVQIIRVVCEDTVVAEDPISPSEAASMPSQTDESLEGCRGSGAVWLLRIFREAVLRSFRLLPRHVMQSSRMCFPAASVFLAELWDAMF